MGFIVADLGWSAAQFWETLKRYFILPFFQIPSDTPDRFRSVRVERGLMVPMRDGVRLNTNVYRPRAEGPFPVVMTRMPYGIKEMYCFMPAIAHQTVHHVSERPSRILLPINPTGPADRCAEARTRE